jgi:transcription elongation factor Elf1
MGLPSRLHGEIRPDPDFHKGFCPRCLQSREWAVVKDEDKYLKQCKVCGYEVTLKTPPISNLIEKVKEKQSDKKKITCPECLREFSIVLKPKTGQKIKCPYCLSEFDLT